jgi:hypothetical protein
LWMMQSSHSDLGLRVQMLYGFLSMVLSWVEKQYFFKWVNWNNV